jgi:hypothetical protein
MFKKLYIALILILILSSWARAEDVKITELPAATSMAVGDIFVIVADPTGSAVTKKITLGNVTATPGAIGAGTPSAGNFTTLGAGAGGFTVDADGDVVGKGFSTPQLTTADNIQLRPGSGATNPTYYRGWAGAPQPVTGFTLYNFPNADPAAGSIMQFGAVSSNVSQVTWLTPGTDVATFLATPSSANLLGALTDETGTGAAVFANSPTLVTPKGIVEKITATFDGGGSAIAVNKIAYTHSPMAYTSIDQWTVICDQDSGTTGIIITPYMDAYAADTLPTTTMCTTGTAPHTSDGATAGGTVHQATWDCNITAIPADRIISFKVTTAPTAATWCTVVLKVTR